ncbi:MAG: hypothetical protein DRI90_28365 [Deltaproteobacteria bacterium]|nr:MAG: hypothetical protein DRI90_28365 [Deltaproteobacteria bacterium]
MRLLPLLVAAALFGPADVVRAAEPVPDSQTAAPSPEADDEENEGSKYPDYVVGGMVSLVAGAAFLGAGVVAAAAAKPKTALGLTGLGTIGLAVGLPLVLVGGADRQPVDSALVGTGTAVATPGIIGVGIGATILAQRVADDDEPEVILPLVLMGVGGAVTVTGIIVWASGAGPAERASARLTVGPTSATLQGTF